ncbi:MAG: glutathione S-transferase family protein [Devosia sp.]|uniref:glutathione S-transferase family protein n=1 Tax=Devosia sp. TaxID=1871048 RepID=UPI002626113B|nr:glutathione S-transferase family protein [Devosia sp.]MDB5529278.1 glutathione S-transferase family protein [Devosia sp.]
MPAPLTLWGRKSSCNVQKAQWLLEELGLSYDHKPVGGRFGGLDDAYRALNPNGLVPTLQDGDVTLWESHAIVRYLAATYGDSSLWPADPRRRALADQWTDWTATTFQPAWIGLFWAVVRTPVEEHDAVAIAGFHASSLAAFAILEAELTRRPYLSGEYFGYADIVAGVSLYRWFDMAIERPAMRAVEAWYARLEERSAFRNVVMVSYAELAGRLAF